MRLRDVGPAWGLMSLVGIFVGYLGISIESEVMATAGLLVIVAGFVLLAWQYRCPHCRCYLHHMVPWRDGYCPGCGEKIDWDKKVSWRK